MKGGFLKLITPIARIAMRSWIGRNPLVRAAYHSCLQPFLPRIALVSLEVEGVEMKLRVPKQCALFSEVYLARGIHEEQVTLKLKNIIRKGMIVVDIGASLGYYVVFAAKLVGENGKVFAFEPNPLTYKLLQENIALNQLNNVAPIQKAISNGGGTTKLWLAQNIEAGNILRRRNRSESIVVETTSLDEFFEVYGLPSIDILIMDIEGAEVLALQGMNQVMENNAHLQMIMEFHPHRILAAQRSSEELWAALQKNGFWPPCLLNEDGQIIELTTHSDIKKIEGKKHPVHLFIKRELKK